MAKRAIYYDTETTGIKAESEFIIEIAAYDPENDRSFEHLINPGVPIPPQATAVHHITDEMVANKPSFKEVGEAFIEFCEGDTVLIAHNNDGFDIHFLREEFRRADIEMPNWNFLDTLKWARRYRPDLPKHTLQFLREIYEIEANNAHRALDDVIILHKVFAKMLDNLTIDQAFELMNKERLLKVMPFGKHQGKPLEEIPQDYIAWLKKNGVFEKSENTLLLTSLEKAGVL